MIIKRTNATPETFGNGKVFDYPMGETTVGISYQEHHGRVPEKGWGINTMCWEAFYVISGKAEVFVDEDHDVIESGDVVVLKPGQKSYIIAENLKLLTVTKPDWFKEQYKEVVT